MAQKMKKFWDELYSSIMSTSLSEEEKRKLIMNGMEMMEQKVNLMITGATGSGKSSTINALFDTEKAKVGVGADPETQDIQKYELDNLILWDSPGLGDGKEADTRHSKNIIDKLYERDQDGNFLIDLVLVILDGSSRDLGTSYDLINSVIIPNLGGKANKRILVAINQCDVAMKGRFWDRKNNKPEPPLVDFLDKKVASVKARIKESTGVDVDPIYYCAGFKDPGLPQNRPYNISKLLYYIAKSTPKKKRLVVANNVNRDLDVWRDDDRKHNYKKGFLDSVCDGIGSIVSGVVDTVGSVFSGIGRAVSSFLGWLF